VTDVHRTFLNLFFYANSTLVRLYRIECENPVKDQCTILNQTLKQCEVSFYNTCIARSVYLRFHEL